MDMQINPLPENVRVHGLDKLDVRGRTFASLSNHFRLSISCPISSLLHHRLG